MRLPPNNLWMQTNRGDTLGSLQGSFNLDLVRNQGKTRVTRMLTNSSGLNNTPVAFKYYGGSFGTNGIYALAGTSLYVNSPSATSPSNAFTLDSQGSSPTIMDSLYSDLEVFNGYVYVSTVNGGGGTEIWKLNSTWSSVANSLGSQSATHMFTQYGSNLYMSSNNVVYKITTGDVSSSALTLLPNDFITFLRSSSNRIWIGTMNKNQGKGYIHEWDGAATQVTRSYRLEASGAFACVIKDDIPYVIDSNGRLLAYTSTSFKEIARLPFNDLIPANNLNTQNNRFIHPNGMSIVNGQINLLINNILGDSASSIPEFCPSGVWEYDESIGLYHKDSLSYTPRQTTTVTDYGQNRISIAGALSEMKMTDGTSTANGDLVAGATIYTTATATTSSIFYNDLFETSSTATQRSGYLVTPKLYSPNVQENWQKIYAFHKKFLNSSNKIVMKYRTSDVPATETSITWSSTTRFTYTATSSEISANTPAYVIGDEVEVTQGTGGGLCAHITDIHFSGSTTVQVDIDETATGASGTAKVRFQKWIKVKTTETSQTSQFKEFPLLTVASHWIQFKVFMIFKGIDELDGLELINKFNQPNA